MADNRLQQWMLPLGRHELFRWLARSTGWTSIPSTRFCARTLCQMSKDTQIRKSDNLTCGRSAVIPRIDLSISASSPRQCARSVPLLREKEGNLQTRTIREEVGLLFTSAFYGDQS